MSTDEDKHQSAAPPATVEATDVEALRSYCTHALANDALAAMQTKRWPLLLYQTLHQCLAVPVH
jgi:hypothetical protein